MAKRKFKQPSVTADIIVENQNKEVLFIERKHAPYKGYWALPGGFLDVDKETVKQTAQRELYEETNLRAKLEDLELIGETSDPKRDERGHIVSLIYVAKKYSGTPKASDDAKNLKWHSLDNLPALAFDHNFMMETYKSWKEKNLKT
jgi:8-oxo-dGTP diphosphatase